MPLLVRWPVHQVRVYQWLWVIEPVIYCVVFLLVQLHVYSLQWLYLQNVISVVQWWLFVIEWWKTHPLKMTTVSLLSTHHYPHRPPLSVINWFNHSWNFINKCYRSRNMIQHLHILNLLPRHWHILQQLKNSMRSILQCS